MPLVNISSISARTSLWIMETAAGRAAPGSAPGTAFVSGSTSRPRSFSPAISRPRSRRAEGHGVPPHLLELEVTEDILLEDDERALATFLRVQKLGVQIAF